MHPYIAQQLSEQIVADRLREADRARRASLARSANRKLHGARRTLWSRFTAAFIGPSRVIRSWAEDDAEPTPARSGTNAVARIPEREPERSGSGPAATPRDGGSPVPAQRTPAPPAVPLEGSGSGGAERAHLRRVPVGRR